MKEMKNLDFEKLTEEKAFEELIDFVKSINESDEEIPEGFADYDSENYDPEFSLDHYMKKCSVKSYIQDLACICFINNDGSVNYKTVLAANKKGIHVYPGESDSFGWLAGCIDTARGTVVFG